MFKYTRVSTLKEKKILIHNCIHNINLENYILVFCDLILKDLTFMELIIQLYG